MAAPSPSEFLNAAAAAYSVDPASQSTLLTNAGGTAVVATRPRDGFHGIATLTDAGQVIVSFEGTDLQSLQTKPTLVGAQVQADAQIYAGESPALYADALRFTQRALRVAEAQGISSDDVFVAGHSLGGAEAEYVSAQTGLAGETFGAPGIPAGEIPAGSTSNLVNYVDYGDPVGNYSGNPNRLGGVLASDSIERYGDATYIGNPSDARALGTAGRLFGTSDVGTDAAFGILAKATIDHHLLQGYAADLGVSLASDAGTQSGLSVGDITTALSTILGAQTGSSDLGGLTHLFDGAALAPVADGPAETLGVTTHHRKPA